MIRKSIYGNVYTSVENFEDYIYAVSYMHKTENIMILLGDDFFYTDIEFSRNLIGLVDKIMERVKDVNVKYATPGEYFDAVLAVDEVFDVFKGDLVPLISEVNPRIKPWTGFYTTKPMIKKLTYDTNKIVRIAEIFQSLILRKKFVAYDLSLATHHDAITGTCRSHVYQDYIEKLDLDYLKAMEAISQSLDKLYTSSEPTQLSLPYRVMFIINPLNRPINKLLSFHSTIKYIKIFDSNFEAILSQSVPQDKGFDIYFRAVLGSFSIKTFFIIESNSECDICSVPSEVSRKPLLNNTNIELFLKDGYLYSIRKDAVDYDIDSKVVRYSGDLGGPYTFMTYVLFI